MTPLITLIQTTNELVTVLSASDPRPPQTITIKYFVSTDLMGFVICMYTWKINDPWSTKKS